MLIFLSTGRLYAEGDPVINNKISVVVIDPGHGGKDPGALGKKIKEKDVVLSIALKLGNYIEQNYPEIKVIYTRKTDVFVPLHERAEIANKNKADVFISIHANSLPGSLAKGTETFVMGRHKDAGNLEVAKKENSVITLEENYEAKYEGFDPNSIDSYIMITLVQNTYQEHSLLLADKIQNQFQYRARRTNRGVKQAGFLVLWQTTMPSILVETGFLTNPDEERYLASENGQDYLASAIYRAFKEYKQKIESNSNFETIAEKVQEEQEEHGETPKPSAGFPLPEDHLYFKLQVLSSKNRIDLNDPYFKNYKFAEEFKKGKWYKYAVGSSPSYKEIMDFAKKAKKDFPDAFVIAIKDGNIVDLQNALDEINRDNEN